MQKRFNITGACIPGKHYMVDTSAKITAIKTMIDQGDYFVINRPRQYGKTTTIYMLDRFLKTSAEYVSFLISFEGLGNASFASEDFFIKEFLLLLEEVCENTLHKEWVSFFESGDIPLSFNQLGRWIEKLVEMIGKKIVLMIDEVDKSSNNQLFLDFLGMLRNKYLKRNQGVGLTFHSVILAGVHDVKTLKSHIRKDEDEEKKFNSPWNIAADFEVDISFSSIDIRSMLDDYVSERRVGMDIPSMAEKLFYFTSGYPFLVSLLCKILDEKIMPAEGHNQWREQDLEKAVQIALKKDNTNFESLIKNLENNPDLYEFIFKLIMNGTEFLFNPHTPVIHFGTLYGILKEEQGKVRVHNRVYEQIIYEYMASKLETSGEARFDNGNLAPGFLDEAGGLNMKRVILKFQGLMKELYSEKDKAFIERNGRLLFLAFIRPIINGRGFDFKEVQVSEEKRLDIVITFDNKKYIIELKIWRGETYHRAGLKQLCDYLDRQQQSAGYLLIYDLRKESGQTGKTEMIETGGKTILAAWV